MSLRVTEVTFEADMLTIRGDAWSLFTMSAWRIIDHYRVIRGSSDIDSATILQRLVGDSVVAAFSQSATIVCDPRLVFASGLMLEVFSTTAVEAWTLRLPSEVVFVASPAEPDLYVTYVE